ncbi:SDR family NAD(P)-dependent oxidoreductase [Limnochorda pilosa]|uniref:2-deoxy-D-gluconate 3-dehydrogenase n=1 Tax=Limnochorda pilosa TaxID=1555112 RepID=A0A0K2SNM0_LIMPI|nr:SDR family oxidoreductase [Limnochorda pilosa]BAS28691.1 2-deoxy-D-gluconate 3-dehydrogenase [Limnochorda pilosa]
MEIPALDVRDQVALVTGAARGIGRSLAVGLAHYGADVAVADLPGSMAEAEEVAAEVRSLGRRSVAVPVDVRDLGRIDGMVAQTVAALGRIDILVNNAGVQVAKPALEVTEADWDAVLDVDLKGVFFCSQRVGRVMKEQGRGSIVSIASQNGVIGYYNRAAYCSAKAGVVNLTRVLALEWAPYGIRVNAVGPTFVRTALGEQTLSNPEFRRDILSRIPLGRVAEPEEIIGAVVFLASPAASMVTGQTLLVDGGWTAQ